MNMLFKLRFGAAALIFLITFTFVSPTIAQYTPGVNNNVTLLSNLNQYSRYSNIWGYIDPQGNEYAIIGHNLGTSIINITDPYNPVEVTMIPGPTSNQTVWREIKTYSHYAYIVTEHTSPSSLTGIQIVDLSGLPNSASYVGRVLWPGVTASNARAHTIFIDEEGYLYIHGGTATNGIGDANGGIRIFSLANPVNPQTIATYATKYVHDIHVRDSILFAHNIFDFPGTIDIINIKDRSNPQLIFTHVYPNGFSHSSWLTDDKNYLVSTDEEAGLTVKVWDVRVLFDGNPNNNEDIFLVSEYLSRPNTIAHEPRIRGNYLYLSHYVDGLRVVDLHNPADPVEVGYYDTYPGSGGAFNGAWGVHPYFPSGNIVISDINTGLYILRFDSLLAGGIQGTVTDQFTQQPLSGVQVRFVEANKTITTSANGTFNFRTNEGQHTIIISRSAYYTDTVQVQLPAGSNISIDFSLGSALARIGVSEEELNFVVPVNSTADYEFLVTNIGTGGTLNFSINDVEDTTGYWLSAIPNNDATIHFIFQSDDLQWLELSHAGGSLTSGQSDTITLTVNTNGLINNTTYNGFLIILSNDPLKETLIVPVNLTIGIPTDIDDTPVIPLVNDLKQNYPNPFNPATTINFSIAESGRVSLKVYNILGNEVAVLIQQNLTAGNHSVVFDGSNFASGIYFYTLKAGNFTQTKKLMLIK